MHIDTLCISCVHFTVVRAMPFLEQITESNSNKA